LAVGTSASAESYLWWKIEPLSALQGENGITFRVFGPQREIALRVTLLSEETREGLVIPAGALQALGLTLRTANGERLVDSEWRSGAIIGDSGDTVVAQSDAVVLEPGDRLEVTLALRPADAGTFETGEYAVGLDLRRVAAGLQATDGRPWTGRYIERGEVTLRIVQPR